MCIVELFLEPENLGLTLMFLTFKKMLSDYTSNTGMHFYRERLNDKDVFTVNCKSSLPQSYFLSQS